VCSPQWEPGHRLKCFAGNGASENYGLELIFIRVFHKGSASENLSKCWVAGPVPEELPPTADVGYG
jgi:hypothetical protein